MNPLQLPGYTEIELIGVGGLGRVYRATRVSTGGRVAIKELRDVESASPAWHRARRELSVMLRLKEHPGVTSVEEVVNGPDGPCIVMEYLSAGSLADRLDAGALTLPEVVLIGRQTAEALNAAHEAGIVHRDVKPHNLLVSSYGHVKVCDFGISTLARELGGGTRTNALTVPYASPEELDESDDIGPPADVYSLAATLQHLLTGAKPSFRERMAGVGTLRQRAATAEPVERAVLELLDAGQAHDPTARPTMAQVAEALDRASAELGDRRLTRLGGTPAALQLRPAAPPPPPPSPPTRARPAPPAAASGRRPTVNPQLSGTLHRDAISHAATPAAPNRAGRIARRVAAGVLVAATVVAGVVIVSVLGRGGGRDAVTSQPVDASEPPGGAAQPAEAAASPSAAAAVAATARPTASPTVAATARPTPPPTTAAVNPEVAARAELDRLVAEDRTFVNTNLLGAHVVQLAGKVLGGFDPQDQVVYDAQRMVALYEDLTARYGKVVIIRQDEYNHSTANPDLYQILLSQPFESKDAGFDWCRAHGLAVPDHCFARDRLRQA